MMQDMILDTQGDLDDDERFHIHDMKISDSMAIELVRNRLLKILYSENRKKEEFKDLVEQIIKHVEPVRPSRSFPRYIIKTDTQSEKYKERRKKSKARQRSRKKESRNI